MGGEQRLDQNRSGVPGKTGSSRGTYLKRIGLVLLALVFILAGLLFWLWSQIRGGLPVLDGERVLTGLSHPVRVERDALGIPSIHAQTRQDLSRALGFLHGQDRFFQMDLLRRLAAGELAELFGPAALEKDRKNRVHRSRWVARKVMESAPGYQREDVIAYADGVNQGLADLGTRPFEYLVLGLKPRPWLPEDCVLVILAMALDLQDENGDAEANLDLMHATLPPELVAFLNSKGTSWDAPLLGEAFAVPPIPPATSLDLRGGAGAAPSKGELLPSLPFLSHPSGRATFPGSNNWAVAGALSPYPAAMLANDMHLDFSLPTVWYRADLHLEAPARDQAGLRLTGVTLPGTPGLTVGSNGSIAWGFTNSYGDWSDLIRLEPDPSDRDRYLSAAGSQPIRIIQETIRVKGERAEELFIRWTEWGPVVRKDYQGGELVCRWIGHFPEAINLEQFNLGFARDVERAMAIANRTGIPAQNFVVVDGQGNLAWTIAGRIPLRSGDGESVSDSSDAMEWTGWLEPADYPRVVNPASGRIWTANTRVVDGEMLERIGFGGYALGARARQIRDRLQAGESFDERAFLAIQLDDEALFLQHWHDLLLELLQGSPATSSRGQALSFIDHWGGYASVHSVGYRLVRDFRTRTFKNILAALLAPCRARDENFQTKFLKQIEGPVWQLIEAKPQHLLHPDYDTWDAWLLDCFDQMLAELLRDGGLLAEKTWGQANTLAIQHPMSSAIPLLGGYLSLDPVQLPGDGNMPRVQGTSSGASERMVVAPGHEENGIFHMPGGQSGHPLSPFFRAGFDAWARGEPTPFLPGPAQHALVLQPDP